MRGGREKRRKKEKKERRRKKEKKEKRRKKEKKEKRGTRKRRRGDFSERETTQSIQLRKIASRFQ